MQAPPLSPKICLVVQGIGHVPSFKNCKIKAPNGLITKPEVKEWMEQAARLIASQLESLFRTNGIETWTGQSALSKIACLMPLDDSRKWIVSVCGHAQVVSSGEEGAIIEIERVT